MSEIDDAIQRVLRFVRDNPAKRSKLARRAGVHRNWVMRISQEREWNPKISTLRALARAVDELEREEARARRKARPNLAA